MPLLILIFPFAELYAFYKFIEAYSFVDALFFVIISALAGILVFRVLGKSTLSLMQRDLNQGRLPTAQILHRSIMIVGGILLIIPGFISSFAGFLCILPGTRHLIALYFKRLMKRGAFQSRVFMGGFGKPGGFGAGGGFGGGPYSGRWEETRVERDAEVVDIEPLEITHKNISSGNSSDDQS